jgi:hypothetical protein
MTSSNHGPVNPNKKGRPFLPGHSIKKPKLPDDLREACKLTKSEAKAKLVQCLQMNIADLNQKINDPETKAIDVWVGRIVLLGIKEGDERRLAWMFDRLFGKMDDTPKEVTMNLHQMAPAKVIEIGEAAIKYLKETEGETRSSGVFVKGGDGSSG